MVGLIIFVFLPFWNFISEQIRSLVLAKLSRAYGYSDYVMKKNSESMIRSILFDLDQKISHLASTRIRNKIMDLFLAFSVDPLGCMPFRLSAEKTKQWRRKAVLFQ